MKNSGFTLAELLIALVILGVIATFTIPKVLQSQQSSQWKSTAKETAAMVSGAFQSYSQNNSIVPATGIKDFTPYMNYVRLASSGTYDQNPGTGGTFNCSAAILCLTLHNGGTLAYIPASGFNTTDNTASVYFIFDPDSKASGNADSIFFLLTPNGRLMNWAAAGSDIYYNGVDVTTLGVTDPPWFSWN